jgi:hypothetical protein
MNYVILAVASEAEAERLRQDLAENPGAPLHTPRWANAVHATLVVEPTRPGTANAALDLDEQVPAA